MALAKLFATCAFYPPTEQQIGSWSSCHYLVARADRIGDSRAASLRGLFSGKLVYSLPILSQGGAYRGSLTERHQRLLAARSDFDLIELSADDDLVPELLQAIPQEQRLIVWHGSAHDDLEARFHHMASTPARWYRLTVQAKDPADGLAPLQLLHRLDRGDVCAYALGECGLWTQPIAPLLGAPLVFAAPEETGPQGFSIDRWISDYGMPHLREAEALYAIAGVSIIASPSPRLHNAAYRSLNRNALFVAVQVPDYRRFAETFLQDSPLDRLGLPLKGLCVIAPYKEEAARLAEHQAEVVAAAGSSNVLLRKHGAWTAATSDDIGVLATLAESDISVRNVSAAVIGCGGSGRTAAVALKTAGARVTLVNRSPQPGRAIAEQLGLSFQPLADFHPEDFQIIVHATPAGTGMHLPPFPPNLLQEQIAVVEYPITEQPTALLSVAANRNIPFIDGSRVLQAQVTAQFRMMTGQDMPQDLFSNRPAHAGTS
ncbi:MAG: type I 3-dehydroquinate dehydratase [Acidobacteriota bacterium]|nr:type I 3-dehydroquinate dehydratase [Acidobacteriota bacterium]